MGPTWLLLASAAALVLGAVAGKASTPGHAASAASTRAHAPSAASVRADALGVASGLAVTGAPDPASARAPGPAPIPVHATGPPPAHTGGFGEPTCAECHIGEALNAYGGSVSIEGLPPAFEPGATYALSVVLRAEETGVAGFQLAARGASGPGEGAPAGTLRAVDQRVTVLPDSTGQVYAQHTQAGARSADPVGAAWTLEWVAPADPVDVVFHVAANSGNDDNSPLGDLVFTARMVVEAVGGGR